jgi:pyruvate dehydrogenase E2 component (dihydrolipoamide acetyltransferase)/2-oxoglutarate dehydrogenase E2 component (dihydrolipoamide succinyltransferase)
MTEGKLIEWLAEDGAVVQMGQPLYVLETDKVETEIEAPSTGTLKIVMAVSDDTYSVGTVVGIIG